MELLATSVFLPLADEYSQCLLADPSPRGLLAPTEYPHKDRSARVYD